MTRHGNWKSRSRMTSFALVFCLMAAAVPACAAQDEKQGAELLRIDADPEKGFHFPCFVSIPESIVGGDPVHLLVVPNNTGRSSDDFAVHEEAARRLAEGAGYGFARELRLPMLVPVFPRPHEDWRIYVHAFDRDTLLVKSGKLERVDLQLLAMVDHARTLLSERDIRTKKKIFMAGFSASGNFANRFALLHPRRVRAVATGGVNGIPILPIDEIDGRRLRFHVGAADLEELTGKALDLEAYRQVAQFIYMGAEDDNDTLPYEDAYDPQDAATTKAVLGESMADRWAASRKIYVDLGIPAQFVTYDFTGHTIRPEMMADVVRFFQANRGDKIVRVEPHRYPDDGKEGIEK